METGVSSSLKNRAFVDDFWLIIDISGLTVERGACFIGVGLLLVADLWMGLVLISFTVDDSFNCLELRSYSILGFRMRGLVESGGGPILTMS